MEISYIGIELVIRAYSINRVIPIYRLQYETEQPAIGTIS